MKLSGFFKRTGGNVGMYHTYGLTPLGKKKSEQFVATTPQSEVLAYLDENGPSSITEIAGEVKTSPQKIKMILRGLMRSGYVRRVNQEE